MTKRGVPELENLHELVVNVNSAVKSPTGKHANVSFNVTHPGSKKSKYFEARAPFGGGRDWVELAWANVAANAVGAIFGRL